mmetsp:Transcript_19530/g.30138  ORF Transcript_19530/g.30138 Transcript_19530/m.30138 type:complete len:245 (-) Transcript_19530:139-873(-)
MELFKANFNLFLSVVTSLFKTCKDRFVIRWGECHMINFTGFRVSPAANNTFDKDLIGNIEEDEAISRNTGLGESVGLSRSARKSIKKPSLFLAIFLVQSVFHNSNDNLIGDKLATVHELLGFLSDIRTSCNSCTKHVTSTKVHDTKVILDHFTLGSLSTCRGSGNDKLGSTSGGRSILSGVFLCHPFKLIHSKKPHQVNAFEISFINSIQRSLSTSGRHTPRRSSTLTNRCECSCIAEKQRARK